MKLRFPGFKILDRYILGKFLATYFFAIAMIIVVVVLFDYVEKIDDFTELHAPLNEVIFDYYLNFIPFFINQFSGLFTFIAVIFFTSKMAYQTEIVAMLSGGMSFRKVVDLLHVVEDHHDHDDHRDSEEVGAQELAEDIPVEDLEYGEAEMRELSFHRGSSVTACGRVWRPSAPSKG